MHGPKVARNPPRIANPNHRGECAAAGASFIEKKRKYPGPANASESNTNARYLVACLRYDLGIPDMDRYPGWRVGGHHPHF